MRRVMKRLGMMAGVLALAVTTVGTAQAAGPMSRQEGAAYFQVEAPPGYGAREFALSRSATPPPIRRRPPRRGRWGVPAWSGLVPLGLQGDPRGLPLNRIPSIWRACAPRANPGRTRGFAICGGRSRVELGDQRRQQGTGQRAAGVGAAGRQRARGPEATRRLGRRRVGSARLRLGSVSRCPGPS